VRLQPIGIVPFKACTGQGCSEVFPVKSARVDEKSCEKPANLPGICCPLEVRGAFLYPSLIVRSIDETSVL
jgi:hypothetical protein